MKINKFNGTNNDWLRNLRIVLDFENQGYILDKPLPTALPEGSLPEEHLTFEKWYEDNRKIYRDKSILRDQDGRNGVKMFSLVEKLEDLKAGLNNDTYIDVILHSLPPSYDPFIVNYNMNGIEKSIHELINMLVQYEAMTHKSEPAVLVGEASTSKVKGKSAIRWKMKKGKKQRSQPLLARRCSPCCRRERAKGRLGVLSGRRQMMCACIAKERGIGRESVHNSSPTQWTPPGTPQLNGVAEWRNQTLLDTIRSMMSFTELPPSFWGYALETAAKLLSIAPSKSVPQTLYEIWHGKPASYKYLRVWGSPVYVKRLVGDKLDSRSSLCRFIGYPKETADTIL
ncbi:UNVERIFIED_CONTAM: hypothetical protein Slati_0852700 [Sesamum latifolium]|uniref:Uncharacterized protein n=1 Tax=Sesamum latifolium TaxID=2727402 RepID=A0AAW2XNI4_9LAMI